MIEVVVVSRQGVAIEHAMRAQFGPAGGTIGRAETNTLVLDDPERTVSRVHAQVLCRNGQYIVVDRGSNAMHSNGQPLGAGAEAPLMPGDQLVIGSFTLVVRGTVMPPGSSLPIEELPLGTAVASNADDPFADLLDGLGGVQARMSRSVDAATPMPVPDDMLLPDPMGGSPSLAMRLQDPFADLGAPVASSAPGAGLLEDFSDLGISPAKALGGEKIDELFGGIGGVAGGLGADPLALSPLADSLLQPNTASLNDPFAALGAAPVKAQAAKSDHVPIGNFGFMPPKAAEAPAAVWQNSAPSGGPMVRAVQGAPGVGETFGFDDQTGKPIRISHAPLAQTHPQAGLPDQLAVAQTPVDPVPAPLGAPAADAFDGLLGSLAPPATMDDFLTGLTPAVSAVGVPAVAPVPAPVPVSAAPSEAVTPAVARPSPKAVPPVAPQLAGTSMHEGADMQALLSALLRGLGPVQQAPTVLTPALMERLGSLLKSATEGTLQLLLARQELKREVRAEVTMIAAQANNPLKFSPTAEVALTHLLGPGMRGFMPAEAAMQDAYNDLRAHQFGVMVGMRAALEQLIARFEPAELEKKIAAKSALDSFFSAGRKAKLWDQFTSLYGSIATEAEDDFHALFGRAFLEAYEAQMARLKDEG